MKVLIAGGAGYIGSTVASACTDAGISPVILDNLVTGRREFAVAHPFYEGDIADGPLIDRIFTEHPDIGAVVHCAALIVVPDSVADPVGYYQANVAKSLDFVAHLLRNGCDRMIFSSSAAIYRASEDLTVDEDSAVDPQSPYARTKAVCEAMFADIAAAEPIRVLSLRYFNPIGADPKMRTGLQLRRPTHALGKMIQAQDEGVPFVITGTGWPTRDGSGIRDYVHVWDLALAHVAALRRFGQLDGAGLGHQPGHRPGYHGPGAAGRVQPSDRPSGARPGSRAAARATSPVPIATSTGPNGCSAGGRSTTSPKASVTRCNGPRYGMRFLRSNSETQFREHRQFRGRNRVQRAPGNDFLGRVPPSSPPVGSSRRRAGAAAREAARPERLCSADQRLSRCGAPLGRSTAAALTSDDAAPARDHNQVRPGHAGPRPGSLPKRVRYERKSRAVVFRVSDNEVRDDRDNK